MAGFHSQQIVGVGVAALWIHAHKQPRKFNQANWLLEIRPRRSSSSSVGSLYIIRSPYLFAVDHIFSPWIDLGYLLPR